VAAHGRDVTGFTKGDLVYVYSYPLYDNGAWAEFMLVPATYVAAAPATMDLTRAGAVPIVGLTAHETLTSILDLQPQQTVLITAAAGGVGHVAVQIAADIGAHVVATASRRNHDFVRDLGAEMVIDYTEGDFIPTLRGRYPKGVDKALNGVSGETANQVIWALRDGGHMVDLTGSASAKRPNVQLDTDYVVRADGKRLAIVRQLIDEKRLKVKIQEVFPFERAPDALERVLDRHVRGKVAIQVAR
jgi:NADPH2:quinone reductase